MFFKREGKPEKGELLVCTVKKILPHAAFVILDEFNNLEAMLHVSEISSRWVKNIKDHISEGKKIVCKVLEVKPNGHIDVSLKRVTNAETKRKLNEIKIERRMEKLIESIARNFKEDPKEGLKKIGGIILQEFDTLSDFSNEIKREGPELIKELDLPKKWKDELYNQIYNQLKSQMVKLCKIVDVSSYEGDAIVKIRKLFEKIYSIAKKNGVEMKIRYISSPRYSLGITIKNYKMGESFFEKLLKEVDKFASKNKIKFDVVGPCK